MKSLCKSLRTTVSFVCLLTTSILAIAGSGYSAEEQRHKAYFEPRFFLGPILHVDDQKFETSWVDHTFEDAAPAFKDDPAASAEFERYLEKAKFSRRTLWGGLAGSVAFMVLNHNNWHLPRRESEAIMYTTLYGSLFTGIYLSFESGKNLLNAVNLFNGFKSSSGGSRSQSTLTFAPAMFSTQTGAGAKTVGGLAASLNF